MDDAIYTLGHWRVKADQQPAFIASWKALGELFSKLPNPPGSGTLIQSVSDPELFYSFGPWRRLEDVQDMRRDPHVQAELQCLMDLCIEATPGAFRVVESAAPTKNS